MLLAIDLGNTRLSFGLFRNGKLNSINGTIYPKSASPEFFEKFFSSAISETDVDACVISSVVDELNDVVMCAIKNSFNITPLFVNSDLKLCVKLSVENPKSVGADRLSNVCAASVLYKQRPLIVVDSGTATTFEVLDKENNFIGGLIMPGIDMQLNSLGANTSKLPTVKNDRFIRVAKTISDNTEGNILSGVVLGHVYAVQGLIKTCEEELKERAFVVATGGNAKLLDNNMTGRKFDAITPNLTLEGLNVIYNLNK